MRVSHGSRSGHRQDGRALPHLPGVPPTPPPVLGRAPSLHAFSLSGRLLGWVGPCTHDPSPQTASQERGQLGYSTANGRGAGG